MSTPGIVLACDKLEDGHIRLDIRLECPAVQEFGFERREEALAHRIVIRIADRSHGGPQTSFLAAQADGN